MNINNCVKNSKLAQPTFIPIYCLPYFSPLLGLEK